MKGMIKFYNKDKGFGFVAGENNQDYYFNQKVIPFGYIPQSGDMIAFGTAVKPTGKHKNPEITTMAFSGERANNRHNSEIITCPHCHKTGKPRFWYERGVIAAKLCTACGRPVELLQGYHDIMKSVRHGFLIFVSALLVALILSVVYPPIIAYLPIMFITFFVELIISKMAQYKAPKA